MDLHDIRDANGDTKTYVDVIESCNAVRFAVSVGDRRPLYCTAGGRVLLAALLKEDLRRYFARLKPKQLTTHTEVSKRALADIVATARESGVAQTADQATEGVTGTAAAISRSLGHRMPTPK